MKFGKQLKLEAVEEWREYYISYKKLKRVLKKAEINIKSPAPQRNKVTAAVDIKAEYSQILEGDLKTINEFFKLKLEELRSRLEQLKRVTKRGEDMGMPLSVRASVADGRPRVFSFSAPDQGGMTAAAAAAAASGSSSGQNYLVVPGSAGGPMSGNTHTVSPIPERKASDASDDSDDDVPQPRAVPEGATVPEKRKVRASRTAYASIHDGHEVSLSTSDAMRTLRSPDDGLSSVRKSVSSNKSQDSRNGGLLSINVIPVTSPPHNELRVPLLSGPQIESSTQYVPLALDDEERERERRKLLSLAHEDLKSIRKPTDITGITDGHANRLAPFQPTYARNVAHQSLSLQELEDLTESLLSLYYESIQLQKYREINEQGFMKISKKFDKTTMSTTSDEWASRLPNEYFVVTKELQALQQETRDYYAYVNEDAPNIDEAVQGYIKAKLTASEFVKPYIVKWPWLLLGLVMMGVILALPIFESNGRARRCLAMLAMITTCWVTEAMPFFVTALLIPFMTIVMRIMHPSVPGIESEMKDAFSHMFSPTIMLVLGGFSISSAFSKYHFELEIANFIQVRIGHRPRLFLLAFMSMGFFLSMWISNVAAPVLCTAVLLPVIRDFPRSSRYARSLMLGLAFACNLGGMLTPISSPQNAVALSYMSISFFDWIVVVVPYGVVCLLTTWVYILLVLKPDDVQHVPEIVFERERMSRNHYVVLFTSFATVALWCTLSVSKPVFGDMGTIAVLPMVTFFGLGILDKEDLKTFSWNLILLLGGGSVLGAAVQESQLLKLVSDEVSPFLQHESLWVATLLVALFVLCATTFISHTVAALIIMPMVMTIGNGLHAVKVVGVSAALMCSVSMSLPMTSFPNLNALLVQDDYNKPYLHVRDFLIHGTPNALFAFVWLMVLEFFILKSYFH